MKMLQVSYLRENLIIRPIRLIRDDLTRVFFSSIKEAFVIVVCEAFLRLARNVDVDNKKDNRVDEKTLIDHNCEKDK